MSKALKEWKTENELKIRLKALQQILQRAGVSAFLVLNPVNLLYFTGHYFKGALLVTEKEPIVFVRRPVELLRKLSGIKALPFKSLKDLLPFLQHVQSVYADILALRHEDVLRIRNGLSGAELLEGEAFVWELRMIKSEAEVSLLKKAARMLSLAIKEWLTKLKLGMNELQASALLEECLRVRGHPGFTRSNLGFELTFGYLISGKAGLSATAFETGEGGSGVEAFPGGASAKRIKKGEPILFDFSGYHCGYYVDQSRMASFGRVKDGQDFFRASLEVHETLERKVKPGILAEEVWDLALSVVEKRGLQDYFMHHGQPMKFVGHGVGLQIDEPPPLAKGQKTLLFEGMVLALEPKFHVPDLGVIGLEDTYLLTSQGLKRLTTFPRDWIVL